MLLESVTANVSCELLMTDLYIDDTNLDDERFVDEHMPVILAWASQVKPSRIIDRARAHFKALGLTMDPVGIANSKVGGPSTYRPTRSTCPTQCPYFGDCYAFSSYTGMIERRSDGQFRQSVAALMTAAAVGAQMQCMVRLHATGDFLQHGELDERYLRAIELIGDHMLRGGHVDSRRVWAYTYTHAHTNPEIGLEGAKALRSRLSLSGVQIVLSDVLDAGGAVVWKHDDLATLKTKLPDGVKILPCPSQTRGWTCRSCKHLCARTTELGIVVVFDPHGDGGRKVLKKSKAIHV